MKKHQRIRVQVWSATSALLGFVLVVASAFAASAASAAGDWQGKLTAGDTSLRVVIHVVKDKDGKLSGTLDSPDQGASGLAISSITFKEPDFHFEVEQIGGSYDGKINKDNSEIAGEWRQGGAALPLTFQRASK